MNSIEMNTIIVDYYNRGAVYYRKILCKGGACIFVRNSESFCIDQIIEICATELQFVGQNICIVAVYRAPFGHFSQFFNSLGRALSTIYHRGIEFIVCGDININDLMDSPKTA
jgi:hypothetical protein